MDRVKSIIYVKAVDQELLCSLLNPKYIMLEVLCREPLQTAACKLSHFNLFRLKAVMHQHRGAPAPECFWINCISNNPTPDPGAQFCAFLEMIHQHHCHTCFTMTMDDDDNDRIAVGGSACQCQSIVWPLPPHSKAIPSLLPPPFHTDSLLPPMIKQFPKIRPPPPDFILIFHHLFLPPLFLRLICSRAMTSCSCNLRR